MLILLFAIAILTSCATPVESVLEYMKNTFFYHAAYPVVWGWYNEYMEEMFFFHATVQYGHVSIIKDNDGPMLTYIRFPLAGGFADNYILEWARETRQNAQDEIDALREMDDSTKGELNIHFDSYLLNDRFVGVVQQGFFKNTAVVYPIYIIETFNFDLDNEIFLNSSDILDFSQIEGILSLLGEKILEAQPEVDGLLDNMDESWLDYIAIGFNGIYVLLKQGVYLPSYIGNLKIILPYDELDFAMRLEKEPEAALGATPESVLETTPESAPTPSVPLQRGDVDPSRPMVALTFDDGPSRYTSHILDLLELYGGRATFFVVGNLIEANSDIVKRAVDLGCEVFGHSWDHRDLTRQTASEIRAQLLNTNMMIESITGISPQFFRPPYGSVNNTVKDVSRELGLGIVNWSVDTLDWRTRDANAVYNAVMNNVTNRAIILSHDLYGSTVEAMERVIPELISKGYQLVTISELMYHSGVIFEAGKVYYSGD